MARAGAILYASAGGLGLLTLMVPGERESVAGLAACDVASLVLAVVCYFTVPHWPVWYAWTLTTVATVIITVAIDFQGTSVAGTELLYLWTLLYAFLFFGRRAALAQAALVAVGYGLAMYLHPPEVGAVGMWVMYVGSFTVAGIVVGMLRDRIEGLLERTHAEAVTDALTGLGNRRRLLADLEAELAACTPERPATLALFDLDGFKAYNDSFGHPAGDAMLARMGVRLADVVSAQGSAYRLGGDEFCVLLEGSVDRFGAVVGAATAALAERGEGFSVGCSVGTVLMPVEAGDPSAALQIADERLYGQKATRSSSVVPQLRDVLVSLGRERQPELGSGSSSVSELAHQVGRRLDLDAESLDELTRAAELHDIGKLAMPDAILHKPGSLDAAEWELMRRHTVIGERILCAVPALRPVGRLVRSSHERFDGHGYPDGLAGDEIALGARILAVCDAYDAMTAARPYRDAMSHAAALAELRRQAGRQFDPAVVAAFDAVVSDGRPADALPASSHDRGGKVP